MSKPLIIAEKPDMARKIAAALTGPIVSKDGYLETQDYLVSYCIGHIMESYKPYNYNPKWTWKELTLDDLPMIVDEWKIQVSKSKEKQFNTLKKLLKVAPSVIHAGDPGREGQLIVDEVLHFLNYNKPVERILLFSLDKVSVRDAMTKLQPNGNFHSLYQAAIGRGIADWFLGMNGSVAYTLLARKNGYSGTLSVGRVQSPTIALVVNRDNEIKNFVPHAFYTISAEFEFNGKAFKTNWKPNDFTQTDWLDKDKRLISLEQAQKIIQKIKGKTGVISSFEQKEGSSPPPLPFNLNNIQIFANNKWGMSAEDTLNACQNLYEKHELQTYPRTDCTYLPEIQHGDASEILGNLSAGFPDLSGAASNANPQIKSPSWNDKKLGEHFGLIPTKKKPNLSDLSANELKIYRAVCERYIVQFYPDCEFMTTQVTVECEQEDFKASGKIIKIPGWQGIFEAEPEEPLEDGAEAEDKESDTKFPPINLGDTGNCLNEKMQSKKTTAPAYFTEASLLKAMTSVHTFVSDPAMKKKLMECKGIGQVATRTGILKNTYERGLLERKGRKILSTSASQALIAALPQDVTSPILTAIWEDYLDKVAAGSLSLDRFKAEQTKWITKVIEKAKTTNIVVPQSESPPFKSAGKSSSSSSAGKSSTSSSTGKKIPSAAPKKGKTCPKCGTGQLLPKVASTSGKKFEGCSNYPECKHTVWPK